ncbi:MAG TPA: PP2C family protein-serine/threonine phosphatase [Terriglobia bacterium]|nr:PP2C family protein-serine/threonine phosphatase [Terriglobia bacterium]
MPPRSQHDWQGTATAAGVGRGFDGFIARCRSFWQRVTDGVALHDLWVQFHADARSSYELYAKEVDLEPAAAGERRWKRTWRVTRALFWAMMIKLSPARRVFFLAALVLGVLGVLDVRFNIGQKEFIVGGGELPLMLSAASLLVLLALELADRVTMKRDLEIAREIQGWLMPAAPPQVPGCDIAFHTRPQNTVAGDYYDAFLRPAPEASQTSSAPGPLLLVVADVAGKSVPAALLMATFQASLRTLAASPTPLLSLIASLNQYACSNNLGGRRFTTAFFAELDPATGALVYVNAGHNWPVLRRASGAVERLEAGGLPFGIKEDSLYESGNTIMAKGDLLMIFTDGLVEAVNDQGEEYGEARLLTVLDSAFGGDAAAVMASLMGSVDAFVGFARQHDDMTCLVLRTL